MKILFLALDVDLRTNRGESVHTRNLAASMTRAGHEVRLVVGADSNPAETAELDVSVRPDGGDLSVLLHVWKVTRTFRPDVIYERRFSPKIGGAVAFLSRRPFVVECNGIAEEEAAMQERPIVMTRVRRFKAQIRLRLLRRAAAVVAVTPGLRDIMVQRYGLSLTKAFVVPNGVDPTLFFPTNKGESRAALGLPSGPLVCYVGNLVRWQGLGGLLDAIRAARTRVDLVIVGDGPDRERLRLNADQLEILHQVHFAGDVRHELRAPVHRCRGRLCRSVFVPAKFHVRRFGLEGP